MRLRFLSAFLFTLVTAACALAAPQLYMAGDSTMADKPTDLPERGWGMMLPVFFKDPAMVHNHAVNGRSTRSFIDEGRWQKIVDALQPGDFVIIQFGHNDEKIENPKVGTDVATVFPANLKRFIADVRAKQALPILATPVARRKFDATGKLQPTHGKYPDAIRAVAAEEKVPLLEMEKATSAWLQAAGDEPSKRFFMWVEPDLYPRLLKGSKDDTHYVELGAMHAAKLAVEQIKEQKLPLAEYLK